MTAAKADPTLRDIVEFVVDILPDPDSRDLAAIGSSIWNVASFAIGRLHLADQLPTGLVSHPEMRAAYVRVLSEWIEANR